MAKPTKPKKPAAAEWALRDLDDWNVTTFHAYLMHKHLTERGFGYEPFNNWGAEKRLLKQAIDKYGAHIVKEFIDRGFKQYTPTPQYPGISFGFMFSYMRNSILPPLLKAEVDAKKQAERKEAKHQEVSEQELKEWL